MVPNSCLVGSCIRSEDNSMKVFNCWCRKCSPVRLLQEGNGSIIFECLQCHGSVTVILDPGEVWEERRSYGG